MKKWLIIALIVVIIAGSAGGYLRYRAAQAKQETATKSYQEYEVKLGTISITVTSSGNISTPHKSNLTFSGSGTVEKVNVKVGQSVKKGDILAKQDSTNLELAVAQAEVSLKNAQQALDKTMNPYTTADIAKQEALIETSKANLASAIDSLNKAKTTQYSESDIAKQESLVESQKISLTTAQTALDEIKARYTVEKLQQNLADAQTALGDAQKTLADAQKTLDNLKKTTAMDIADAEYSAYKAELTYNNATITLIFGRISSEDFEKTKRDLERARINVEIAKQNSEKSISNAQKSVTNAEKAVETAQTTIDDIKADIEFVTSGGISIDVQQKLNQVTTAKVNLSKAEEDLAKMKEAPSTIDITIKQAQISTQQASIVKSEEDLAKMKAGPDKADIDIKQLQLKIAQTSLDTAKQNLENATMKAPFDAIVTVVNAQEGLTISGTQTAITLVDTSQVELNAVVDEIDILKVKTGQEVNLSISAAPDRQIPATVTYVSPSGKIQQGVVSYDVTISIARSAAIALKEGMSATADIIIQKQENVPLIPVRALQGTRRQYYVELVNGETVQQQAVTVGINNGIQVEITSGLKEGDKIRYKTTSGTSTTAQPTQQAGFRSNIPGVGGGILPIR